MANTSEHLNWRAPHDRSPKTPRRLKSAEIRAVNKPLAARNPREDSPRYLRKAAPRSRVVLASQLEDIDRTANVSVREDQTAPAAPGPEDVRARRRADAGLNAFQDRTPAVRTVTLNQPLDRLQYSPVRREPDVRRSRGTDRRLVRESSDVRVGPRILTTSATGELGTSGLAQADTQRLDEVDVAPFFPEADPLPIDSNLNFFENAPAADENPPTAEPPLNLDRLILESASNANAPEEADPPSDLPQPLPSPLENSVLLDTVDEVQQRRFEPERDANTDNSQVESIRSDQLSHFGNQDCDSQFASCRDDFARLAVRQQTNMSIDITPSFRPRELNMAVVDAEREEEMAKAPSRTWRDRQGTVLAEGRLTDYRHGKIYIRTLNGTLREFSPGSISDEDWCFVTSWWQLPPECRFDDEPFQMRDFRLTTFTWTAPALCHKPLYFEEVQLERYGHSAGPIVQPFLSGAHFFGSALMLPYQIGLNPPNECQYALGYYRPGDCAPWLLHGYPITTRGLTWHGLALGAAITLLP